MKECVKYNAKILKNEYNEKNSYVKFYVEEIGEHEHEHKLTRQLMEDVEDDMRDGKSAKRIEAELIAAGDAVDKVPKLSRIRGKKRKMRNEFNVSNDWKIKLIHAMIVQATCIIRKTFKGFVQLYCFFPIFFHAMPL